MIIDTCCSTFQVVLLHSIIPYHAHSFVYNFVQIMSLCAAVTYELHAHPFSYISVEPGCQWLADVKGVFVVEAEAAAQFMHDVSKANTAEAGLHLLSAVLGRQNASHEAVAATEANALQVHETALTPHLLIYLEMLLNIDSKAALQIVIL